MSQSMSVENFRVLSQIFTPSYFNKIVREKDTTAISKRISKHFPQHSAGTNLELIQKLYSVLENNYRCEYFFKNKLYNQILSDYKLSTTTTLNEFRVAGSKADLVMLNGAVMIFEIKTDLDDLSKLKKQIQDYQKFADYVYVVTDPKFVSKLLLEYGNTNIGIKEFTSNNILRERKKAIQDKSNFDFDCIFKLLHKKEYLGLVKKNFNFLPDVPNTKIFKVCYEILQTLDINDFQRQVLKVLKNRKLNHQDFSIIDRIPEELRYICHALNFNVFDFDDLQEFLNQSIYVPTLPQRKTI